MDSYVHREAQYLCMASLTSNCAPATHKPSPVWYYIYLILILVDDRGLRETGTPMHDALNTKNLILGTFVHYARTVEKS